MDLKDHLDRL